MTVYTSKRGYPVQSRAHSLSEIQKKSDSENSSTHPKFGLLSSTCTEYGCLQSLSSVEKVVASATFIPNARCIPTALLCATRNESCLRRVGSCDRRAETFFRFASPEPLVVTRFRFFLLHFLLLFLFVSLNICAFVCKLRQVVAVGSGCGGHVLGRGRGGAEPKPHLRILAVRNPAVSASILNKVYPLCGSNTGWDPPVRFHPFSTSGDRTIHQRHSAFLPLVPKAP